MHTAMGELVSFTIKSDGSEATLQKMAATADTHNHGKQDAASLVGGIGSVVALFALATL